MTEKINSTTSRMVDLPDGLPLVRTRWDKGQMRPARLVETVAVEVVDGETVRERHSIVLGGPMVTAKGTVSSSRRGEAAYGQEIGDHPLSTLPPELREHVVLLAEELRPVPEAAEPVALSEIFGES